MAEIYIDECKSKNYLLVGFVVAEKDALRLRMLLRKLLLPGQRSIHFHQEGPRRRKQILNILLAQEMRCVVFTVKGRTGKTSRISSIKAMANHRVSRGFTRLVFELDESSLYSDNRILNDFTYSKKLRGHLTWSHIIRHQEPLLWVADAVAWCLNRGGDWERMVRPMILESVEC